MLYKISLVVDTSFKHFAEIYVPIFSKIMWSVTIYVEGLAYDLFDRDCVTEHNKLRRLHGSQSLSWSESLAVDAQKWAEYLAINDKIEHDGDTLAEKDEGENIAWFVPPQPKCQGSLKPNCFTCSEVVQNWYDESGNYNYQMGIAKKPDLPIKHFAQVINISSYQYIPSSR